MPYYKIKLKSVLSGRDLWIAIQAEDTSEGIEKAHQYCAFAKDIFFPLEQDICEIDKDEYDQFKKKDPQ
jgi:hypothetical protein